MQVRGEEIRAVREERGYTLQELAKRAKLSLSYLSEIERGTKRPSMKALERIAAALDISKHRLIRGEGSKTGLLLGQRIRLFRGEMGLSIQELASRAGISASYLGEIERGVVYPSVKILKMLAGELGVPVYVLLGQGSSLGHRLKALREEYGLTQARLARLAGVTAGLIGQIEQGKVQPSLNTLEKIAQALGVSPCYFITESGSVNQLLETLSPDVRELLLHPNVQAILNLACNLNRQELQFILNFILLYKKSSLSCTP
ncbi:MAG TPA: transcriptional regulator [Peptococcaceae bacterium]|nr:transcriptional regulator [Peptococcaceae bacterium]